MLDERCMRTENRTLATPRYVVRSSAVRAAFCCHEAKVVMQYGQVNCRFMLNVPLDCITPSRAHD